MILSVSRPLPNEFDLLHEGQILCGFLHLAVTHPAKSWSSCKRKINAIAYETIQLDDGELPGAPADEPDCRTYDRHAMAARLLAEQRGAGTASCQAACRGAAGQSCPCWAPVSWASNAAKMFRIDGRGL